jgi:hypothetical protein
MIRAKVKESKEETYNGNGAPGSEVFNHFISGAHELINLVQDQQDYYEPLVGELKDRNYDLLGQIDMLQRRNSGLE